MLNYKINIQRCFSKILVITTLKNSSYIKYKIPKHYINNISINLSEKDYKTLPRDTKET